MKKIILLYILLLATTNLEAQGMKIYYPEDNAQQKIDSAVTVASQQNKFVFLQIGGNWCMWCLKFNKFSQETPEIKKILDTNFIIYHLNYSNENKNEDILAYLGYPQRFGFPVFVILNEKGERIHTQQTDFLEDEEGYDIEKVKNFLLQWSPTALDSKTYN